MSNEVVNLKEDVLPPVELAIAPQSDSIAKLAAALAKAQGIIGNAHKDSTNPFFKSKYADLASCWDACREALSKNELAVIQTHEPVEKGDMVILTTTIVHSSGQFIKGTICVRPSKTDPQGYGSATTYARRYGLCAMVGISPADDDGNAASGNVSKPKPTRQAANSTGKGKSKTEAKSKDKPAKEETVDDDEF